MAKKKKSKTPINVQHNRVEPFVYRATLVKVVDGDTIDVTLDLALMYYYTIKELDLLESIHQKAELET